MRFCMVTTLYPLYSFGGDGIFVERLSYALAITVVMHVLEVPGMLAAYRGQEIGTTAYR